MPTGTDTNEQHENMTDTKTSPTGDKSEIPSPAPASAGREAWEKAMAVQRTLIVEKQIELLKARIDLQEMHGTEDHQGGLLKIVEEFPDGISFALIRGLYEDQAELTKARNALEHAKKIKNEGNRRPAVLVPIQEVVSATGK